MASIEIKNKIITIYTAPGGAPGVGMDEWNRIDIPLRSVCHISDNCVFTRCGMMYQLPNGEVDRLKIIRELIEMRWE